MLTMRRHEKDFMLRRDARYGDDMKKRAAEFLAGVEQAGIPEAAKIELKQKLADYQRDFQGWMGQALKLAAWQARSLSTSAYAQLAIWRGHGV